MSRTPLEELAVRPPVPLEGKRVLLGVTGGIAAYKAADLASMLVQTGASVTTLMTPAATRFVSAETFSALTQNRVYADVLEQWVGDFTGHISLGQNADAFVIAPATANTIAKLALGLSDDMISATALVTRAPMVIAPAMEHGMYHHPATQANLELLRNRGAIIVGPDRGRLASGEWGDGRLAPMVLVAGAVRQAIAQTGGKLTGRHVVVTAGGTHEAIDPVRFIGNRSSGRMGYAVAQSLIDYGAHVTLISGPSTLVPPVGPELIHVESAQEMHDQVHAAIAGADAIVMTAAVADYRPAQVSEQKIKKSAGQPLMQLQLEQNTDIIASLRDAPVVRVGFAAVTNDHLINAQAKLVSKNLDIVVVNDAVETIGSTTSQATIVTKDQEPVALPRMLKERLAIEIVDRLATLLDRR
ncbi:MAG: bifunctional phosphopantothenoylcysteine decarboxylase/phosphopantothenate--cysteine ligase CoaBC [Chloroflexota bacterium]|nr:bifunctional phosphopantothenoylcysteine decarboxylase/phosphopantothenate--cysteine ligase CoaBC [Chloroflexota bacterium]